MSAGSDPSPVTSAEAELQLAETQISTILTIAADAIISLNDELRITLFNDGCTACARRVESREEGRQ